MSPENFRATPAIPEILLPTHHDEIKLLPALAGNWQDGHARGLGARGDITVDIGRKADIAKIDGGKSTLSQIPVV